MTSIETSTVDRSRLAVTSAATGVVAAVLTTHLSFISLVLGVVAIATGTLSWRRSGSNVLTTLGVTAATVSLYVIVTEIFIVGG